MTGQEKKNPKLTTGERLTKRELNRPRQAYLYKTCVKQNTQASVVRTPVSANPGLNFNSGFFSFLSKALSRILFFILFRVSNHQIVGKENLTEFAF